MSTTGNEYEQPGVNYPDREDADGATATPAEGEPVRDGQPEAAPAMGEPSPDADPAGTWADAPEQADAAAATGPSEGARSGEPSHEAVGVGVIDTSDHHGQDGGRDTQTVGEAQRTPGALGTEQEQRLPAMAQNNASDVDKVAGIVAQTRQDVGTEPLERIAEVLRQRLTQSGIDLPDHDVEELARQVSTGDTDDPAHPHHESAG